MHPPNRSSRGFIVIPGIRKLCRVRLGCRVGVRRGSGSTAVQCQDKQDAACNQCCFFHNSLPLDGVIFMFGLEPFYLIYNRAMQNVAEFVKKVCKKMKKG